ncbi:YkvA family protein [Falsiroseomonas oryzae]|uniref:YkvA family protein n=1 Tax=Falsiroseomonas oryzae TaxID=2766473 RepID=UPI0038CBF3FC
MLETAKLWARGLRRDVHAVWLAARHPGTPWHAKALALAVAAYALSPIDLIPDFIPVLGYLDDLILVPLGILAVRRLIPPAVLAECRAAAEAAGQRPRSLAGAWAVVALWLAAAGVLLSWFWPSAPA